MISAMLLGLLLGMRHALEADHIAAVASLVVSSRSTRISLLHGAAWGVGHTMTLMVVGTFVILTHSAFSTTTAVVLEGCVGLMLIALGLDVARRMVRDRIHLHLHEHPGGVRHFHAHSHTGASIAHQHDGHEHRHLGGEPHGFPKRAVFVGLMHGLAGSAALVVWALRTTDSVGLGLLYMALFGLGSVIGMALLSATIAMPFNYSGRHQLRLQLSLQGIAGLTNLGLGAYVIVTAYSAA
jgi:hypothetical protein